MSRTICIIPAKGGSTRLPRKNLLSLGGHPLIAHAIRKAFRVPDLDRIVVSTEDEEVAQVAQRYDAEVPFVRPKELSVDPATIADVCVHALRWHRAERGETFDRLLLLLPTSPLVLVSDIRDVLASFERSGSKGCVLTVCQTESPPYTAQLMIDGDYLRPAVPESPFHDKKSTECPTTYHSNGCVCVVETAWLERERGLYGAETRGFIMDRLRSVDIDTPADFTWAKALYEIPWIEKEKDLFA